MPRRPNYLIALAMTLLMLSLAPAEAQQPQIVITAMEVPGDLSAHERHLLGKLDWVSELESQLQSSRSVQILSRDRNDLTAIIEEHRLANLGQADGSSQREFGLKVSDSLLRPSVVQFDVHTAYRPVELLDDVFERSDSVNYEVKVEVLGLDGGVRFSKTVSGNYSWPAIEESAEQKRRGRYRATAALKRQVDKAVTEIVDAISIRINPISVVDVNPDYFVVDRGADAGLEAGDKFTVYARSKIVELPNGTKRRIPGITVGEAVISEVHDDVAFATFSPMQDREIALEVGFTLRAAGDTK